MRSKKKGNEGLRVGDKVKLISVPEWLLTDLPEEEQLSIVFSVGKYARIKDIDNYGYFWVDCSGTLIRRDRKCEHRGHLFSVDKGCLEKSKSRRKKLRGESIVKKAKTYLKETRGGKDARKAKKMLEKLINNHLLFEPMAEKIQEDAAKTLNAIASVA
jgi:hypothetical protein